MFTKILLDKRNFNYFILIFKYFFQKSFIAFFCCLAVTAAQKPSPFYIMEAPRLYYRDYPTKGHVERSISQSAPAYRTYSTTGHIERSISQTAPVVDSNTYSEASANFSFTDVLDDFNFISKLINDPYFAIGKAQDLLEDLNSELPEALAKMDPAVKDDIKHVNALILDICDKAVANTRYSSTTSNYSPARPYARPSSNTSYYSPAAVISTCEFIHKHVPTVSQGLDDPTVISNLIEKLGEFGSLATEFNDLFE